jgi:hypothetical protein
LSQTKDFCKEKRPGERSNIWTFKSAKTRKDYAKELSNIRVKPALSGRNSSTAKSDNLSSHSRDDERTNVSLPVDTSAAGMDNTGGITTEGLDGAASSSPKMRTSRLETIILDLSSDSDENNSSEDEHPGFSNTTEQATSQDIPWRHLKRELAEANEAVDADFFSTFPEYMTEFTPQQRENKGLEIKERPSRKATFGQLLVHARRYRRRPQEEVIRSDYGRRTQDLVSRFKPEINGLCTWGRDQVNGGEALQRWREVLDLPEIPIPIVYEGQLSFREGVLVNGKLPRPRVIYKVGRNVAGELI